MPGPVPFGKISRLLERHGLSHHGFARLETPLTIQYYRDWLARGDHADMAYLHDHLAWKADPRAWAPRIQTAIVIALPYLPHPYPKVSRITAARVAAYARGRDYHHAFLGQLNRVALALKSDFLREKFLCYADTAPVMERDLAARAGLGWFGKNTCLIDPKRGSFFLLGHILTTMPYATDAAPVVTDHCGTCTRCLDACPTGALEGPRRLNARKCISYWTIEARTAPPVELRPQMGDWLFGCDVCQTVCPWNQRGPGRDLLADLARPGERSTLIDELRWVLISSHREVLRGVAGTPLTRARPATMKRNALIVIGNKRLTELRPEVELALARPELKEVADWTLERLR